MSDSTPKDARGALLEVRGLTVDLGPRRALDAFDLDVLPGERLAVLGPSGAGKTTLLRALAGLVAPSAGSIRLGGRPASEAGKVVLPPERRGVGLVFQGLALWPQLSVRGTLAFVSPEPPAAREAAVEALAERVGLGERLDAYPDELSGGEQQRLALARALAPNPGLLLLDEPFAHLDPPLRWRLGADLLELLAERGTTLVLVTHQRREVLELAQRVAVLEDGRLCEHGALEHVVARPRRRATVELLGLGSLLRVREPKGAEVDADGGDAGVSDPTAPSPTPSVPTAAGPVALARDLDGEANATAGEVLVRPEQVVLVPDDDSAGAPARVRRCVVARPDALAARYALVLEVEGEELVAASERPRAVGEAVRVRIEGACPGLVRAAE